MIYKCAIGAAVLAVLSMAGDGALAQQVSPNTVSQYDLSRYPDWSGPMRFTARGGNRYDQTKPSGRAQEAPLTPEYRAIFEAGLRDQAAGGQGGNQTFSCFPGGMPREMAGNQGLEFLVTPKATHVIFAQAMPRRIYTDGRAWPDFIEPTLYGYSIGKWLDEDRDGRFDLLEVETRGFMGPRSFDNAGHPLHADNQTVIKERIYRDKNDPDILHDEMTTIDNALTRPWTVLKTYKKTNAPDFVQNICSAGNNHVQVGKDSYFLSADGFLMPVKKDQAPPDLRYFNTTRR
jgi:hypothetical protein